MYASEERSGLFPGGGGPKANSWTWWRGINSTQLYPDYWSDANIMICPSDTRSPWAGADSVGFATPWPDIAEDVVEQVQNIDSSVNPLAARLARHAILSFPISYIYTPYAASNASQMEFAFHSCATDPTWGKGPQGIIEEFWGQDVIAQVGGPSTWYGIVHYRENAEVDISGFSHMPWWSAGFFQPDGRPVDPNVPRLREGIERFFITDINNPASGTVAQSSLLVMWDSYGRNDNWDAQAQGRGATLFFNHIPGGCNVLFLDGHVQFRKYQEHGPLPYDAEPSPNYYVPGSHWSQWTHVYGGMG
jgi:prepilin-type processing-associated H-X9-DG protein